MIDHTHQTGLSQATIQSSRDLKTPTRIGLVATSGKLCLRLRKAQNGRDVGRMSNFLWIAVIVVSGMSTKGWSLSFRMHICLCFIASVGADVFLHSASWILLYASVAISNHSLDSTTLPTAPFLLSVTPVSLLQSKLDPFCSQDRGLTMLDSGPMAKLFG